ncbi:MAG: hypothetical protein Q9P90_01195 [candidate division KSB1 bacterium]|nr:hypothetical protein [candidate division KSB1 bacterium]
MLSRWLTKMKLYEGDPKSGPPPGPSLAPSQPQESEQPATAKTTLLMLSEADPKSGPPPTDNYYPDRSRFNSALLDAPKFGIALGLASALIFLIISLLVAFSGAGHVLSFFELIFPDFSVNTMFGMVLGVLEMFVFGFILGLFIAILYNSLMRHQIQENESWEVLG